MNQSEPNTKTNSETDSQQSENKNIPTEFIQIPEQTLEQTLDKNQTKNTKSSLNQNVGYVVVVLLLMSLWGAIIFQGFKNPKNQSYTQTDSNSSSSIQGSNTTPNTTSTSSDLSQQKDQILKILKNEYIGDLPNDDKITQGELEGLVSSVGDKYTTYLSCKNYQSFQNDLNQDLDGIGARFKQYEDYIVVDDVISGSPSQLAGIQKGDILATVDKQSADDLSFNKVIEKIRGKAGTKVTLQLDRPIQSPTNTTTPEPTYQRLSFDIVRQSIHVDAVVLKDKGDTAWIEVSTFSKEVDSQMDKIATQIKQNPKFKNIVLDLRDNGGGFLDQAVELSSYFLKPDSVVLQEKTKDNIDKQYSTSKSNNLMNYPLLVAINGGTASASEITAMALRDNNRAKIIGKTSYGKGVVQEIFNLAGCDKIKVTVAEWLGPTGSTINNVGVTPDIRVTRGENLEKKVIEAFANPTPNL